METFLKGLVIGFSIAVPVGPIGFLCLRRTLAHGRRAGFLSGLGAATADALYGAVAALGLSAISTFLLGAQSWLQFGGGLFLVALGAKTALARPPPNGVAAAPDGGTLTAAYFSTFALTLASPPTILAFIAIFAALGIGATAGGAAAALSMVAGVFVGSACWWLLLSLVAGQLRRHLNAATLRVLHAISGGCIAALGAWQLWLFARSRVL
jgi:threonine/homoserine/homoserine lactone efflux protein